jgi:hypothetical protein
MTTLVMACGQRGNPEDRVDCHGASRLAMMSVVYETCEPKKYSKIPVVA